MMKRCIDEDAARDDVTEMVWGAAAEDERAGSHLYADAWAAMALLRHHVIII